MTGKKYTESSDEELILRFRNGEGEIIDYLMEKYKEIVKAASHTMYLLGGEKDDLIQEGMIGLFKAVTSYNPEKKASFSSYARTCIHYQMYKAIKASNRDKHKPLNTYQSLDDEEPRDTLAAGMASDPVEVLIGKEYLKGLEDNLADILSPLERRVFLLRLAGNDNKTICRELGKSPKQVDNALQRIRKKLEEYNK